MGELGALCASVVVSGFTVAAKGTSALLGSTLVPLLSHFCPASPFAAGMELLAHDVPDSGCLPAAKGAADFAAATAAAAPAECLENSARSLSAGFPVFGSGTPSFSPPPGGFTIEARGYGEQSIGEKSMGVPAWIPCAAQGVGVLKLKSPAEGPKPMKLLDAVPFPFRLWVSVLRVVRRAVPVAGVLPGVNMLTLGVKALGVLASPPPATDPTETV